MWLCSPRLATLPGNLVFYFSEVPAKESDDLAYAVGPRLGIAAGRSTAASGGVRVNTGRNVADGIVAVERVVCPRVYLDCHRIPSLRSRVRQLAAGFRWRPVVVFSYENQQRSNRLIDASITKARTIRVSSALNTLASQANCTVRIQSDGGREACSFVSRQRLSIGFCRCHRGASCGAAVRTAHEPDPASV